MTTVGVLYAIHYCELNIIQREICILHTIFSILYKFLSAASSIPGHTLNITKVNRVHMGAYQCIADNGIPPAANATYHVEVHCE